MPYDPRQQLQIPQPPSPPAGPMPNPTTPYNQPMYPTSNAAQQPMYPTSNAMNQPMYPTSNAGVPPMNPTSNAAVPPMYPTRMAQGGAVPKHPMDMADAQRTDHTNKSYKYADGGFLPSFLGSAASTYGNQRFGPKGNQNRLGPFSGGSSSSTAAGTPASSIDDTDDYDTSIPKP